MVLVMGAGRLSRCESEGRTLSISGPIYRISIIECYEPYRHTPHHSIRDPPRYMELLGKRGQRHYRLFLVVPYAPVAYLRSLRALYSP